MYEDQPFHDPILLSREVLKKAYHEGLFYIAKKEMVEEAYQNKKFSTRKVFVTAGVPSIEEIALTHAICPTFYALKINLPYEILAEFQYKDDIDFATLENNHLDLNDATLEIVSLDLTIEEKKPIYIVKKDLDQDHTSWQQEDIEYAKKYFLKSIQEYIYIIKKNLDLLKEKLIIYASMNEQTFEDDKMLQLFKESYETLTYEVPFAEPHRP